MSAKTVLLIIAFYMCSFPALAQDDSFIKDLLESLAENLPEDVDLYELTERLNYLRSHPININETTAEKLKQLIFLSPLQINNLMRHLEVNGKLIDLVELQSIDGFDLATVGRLLPFVTLSKGAGTAKIALKDMGSAGTNDLMLRYGRVIQVPKGYTDLPGSRYLGSQDRMLLRYKYAYNTKVSVGLVMEKDDGESYFKGKVLSDHFSANLTFNNIGSFKKVIIGDYSLQFGQGLTMWSGFGFGKGPDVTSVAARDVGLRSYSSSNEASFFRGFANTLELWKNIELTSFISYRKRDGSLKLWPDSTTTIQTINESGYHRTKTELKNQNSLGQLVFGGALQYLSDNLNIGFVGYQSLYDQNFITGNSAYNKYAFTGSKLVNTGLHYSYTFKNVYSYGEIAHSIDGGWAVVNGLLISLSPKLSGVLLHRNYDRDYRSFFSNAVGESSDVSNEKGLYTGINFAPSKRFLYSIYFDYFKFPWLKFRVDSASKGHEILVQGMYTPKKTLKILLRFKQELKQQNPDATDKSEGLKNVLKGSGRAAIDWKLNKTIDFQHRVEVSIYKKGDVKQEVGKLIYSDFNYHPSQSKVSGNIRVAYFNTPSYNSRIYAYEDDVLYGSSFGVYSEKGFRCYSNIRYKITRKMDLWARYALTFYQDKETISSGLDEIAGNKKSDAKVQLRYQF
ncbi:MAG: helix-hairpin-helix domain-containing protein [Flavobacterium sp.]|nr:MAG: helix-hairpin-helix domain-containing protein [Flavobacterium sp.]